MGIVEELWPQNNVQTGSNKEKKLRQDRLQFLVCPCVVEHFAMTSRSIEWQGDLASYDLDGVIITNAHHLRS